MDQAELSRVEQELREALQGTVLAWVLDDVDAAIAAGVPEEKILRRRPQRRGDDLRDATPALAAARYEVVDRSALGFVEYEASRKRGTLVIATRAMTDHERVQLILDSVQRVFVELPQIELETLKMLQTEPEGDLGTRGMAEGVMFEPDESTSARRSRTELSADRLSTERRDRVSDLLAEVEREARS
ncbi:hypothetical protein HCC61_23030 [Streptomyces sp. HNM0575]|uniref:hypothetical protein n=1 Tax=Streptomyces sp. HNM0575 TaxID=2716338 RepID=UPI00145ECA8B|nr:hypothetical protein [Streptomyces sp. HNM0575]NLU75503.1 hypothetical protein [Streptomyces sp. HNM0575]